MKGRSGQEHQIDVYWELRVADEDYRTVVECKCWAKPVDVGVVRDMLGLLTDLPPGTTGVIVSMMGFQPGAETLADHKGIRLVKVGIPLKHIQFSLNFVSSPTITDVQVQVDQEAAGELLAKAGRKSFRTTIAALPTAGLLVDNDGQSKSLADLFDMDSAGPGHHRVDTPGLSLPTEIGPIPVLHLDVVVEQAEPMEREINIETGETTRAVFDSVLDGHKLFLMDDGTIRRVEGRPAS